MANVFTALNKLKTNIFGGSGNTGFTKPPGSRVQDIDLQPSPTGLLNVDPFAFNALSYPTDVQNNFQNGHYMIFYVNVQIKSKYVYDPADSKKVTDERLKGASQKEIRYEELKAIKTAGATSAQVARKGTTLKVDTGDLWISNYINTQIKKGVKSSMEDTKRITDSVALYLPANVEDNTLANYNDAKTGIAGFLVASGFKAQGGDTKAITESLIASMEGVLKDTTMRAIGVVGEIFGAEGTEGLAKKAFGEADNPYMEVLFDSMQLRTFTYNFTFAPRKEEEALEVQRIIQLFRFHMAPELRPGVNRYLGLPSTFDIHYMFLSSAGIASENNFYNRIATCVLQDCSVNYTPGGVKSFEDGGPTQTTMKLTFKEIQLLTKDKIGEGY